MYLYLLILIITALVSLVAQGYVTSNYSKYAKINTRGGMTGAQVAQYILNKNGINDVQVVRSNSSGTLTDNFDPTRKVVTLSPDVYNGSSIASVSVAAHEVGHAIQYHTGYVGIKVRNVLLKPAIIASQFSQIAILIGIGFISNNGNNMMFNIGIIMMGIVALFQIATLPVEFDASARALKIINQEGIVDANEYSGAKSMLTSAALTYVAAVVGSILNILYYIILRENRNRD